MNDQQQAAQHVYAAVSNMPPLPAPTGCGPWGDEPSAEQGQRLAAWVHLGGRLNVPRYSITDTVTFGSTTVQVATMGAWLPKVGWLVALSPPPLCAWVWRVKEADKDMRGGWSFVLATTTGRPHQLDKQVRVCVCVCVWCA